MKITARNALRIALLDRAGTRPRPRQRQAGADFRHGRQSNTGFTYFAPDNKVLKNGGPPILLEPVQATVAIRNRPIASVNILDHDGRRTGRTLAVTDGRFTLDGTKDKAIYYEVVFR